MAWRPHDPREATAAGVRRTSRTPGPGGAPPSGRIGGAGRRLRRGGRDRCRYAAPADREERVCTTARVSEGEVVRARSPERQAQAAGAGSGLGARRSRRRTRADSGHTSEPRGQERHHGNAAACVHRDRQLQLRAVPARGHRQRPRSDLRPARGHRRGRRLHGRVARDHRELRERGARGPEAQRRSGLGLQRGIRRVAGRHRVLSRCGRRVPARGGRVGGALLRGSGAGEGAVAARAGRRAGQADGPGVSGGRAARRRPAGGRVLRGADQPPERAGIGHRLGAMVPRPRPAAARGALSQRVRHVPLRAGAVFRPHQVARPSAGDLSAARGQRSRLDDGRGEGRARAAVLRALTRGSCGRTSRAPAASPTTRRGGGILGGTATPRRCASWRRCPTRTAR